MGKYFFNEIAKRKKESKEMNREDEKINFDGCDYVRAWCSYLYTKIDDKYFKNNYEEYFEYKNEKMIFVGKGWLNGDSFKTVYTEEYLKPLREFYNAENKKEYANKRRQLRRFYKKTYGDEDCLIKELDKLKKEHLIIIKRISEAKDLRRERILK